MGRGVSDQDLAAWIATDNLAEAQLSRLGQERAKNEQVKQFAQQMIEEHTRFAQQIQEVAGAGRTGAAPRGTIQTEQRQTGSVDRSEIDRGQPRTTQEQPVREQDRLATRDQDAQRRTVQRIELPAARGEGLVAFHAQIGQRCLQSFQEMMGQKEGAEFDKAFMGAQLMSHAKALATLEVAQQHAQSSQLKQLLQQGEQTTQQHMEKAKSLMRQIEHQASEQTGDRGASPQPGQTRD
jgi:predicted outer membrane protein